MQCKVFKAAPENHLLVADAETMGDETGADSISNASEDASHKVTNTI